MEEKLSLTELQTVIKDALFLSFPEMYWVTAEISEIKENNAGHCYLELIEKQSDDLNVRARVKAIIWSNRYRILKPFFLDATGETLKVGIKVLVRVRIDYHEVYGLSLIISDIDPAFTLGEMALKRSLIIKRLEEEGVYGMNRELEFPVVPRNIAVISSGSAAGYTDFINHLNSNSYGYVFRTTLFEASMQGTATEQSVIHALDTIADDIDNFDAVAIIRGGGSQTDLSWFDNYNIAYYITQFPVPVLTGIGHEKDLSVTDMVAYKSLKTPTAVADFLISCMFSTENSLNEMSSRLAGLSGTILEKSRNLMESAKLRLIPVAGTMISDIKERLSAARLDIVSLGKSFIIREGVIPLRQLSGLVSETKSFLTKKKTAITGSYARLKSLPANSLRTRLAKIESLERTLGILTPENILKRGYTVTLHNGKLIKSSSLVRTGDIIDTQFSDGKINSKVL